MKKGFTLIELLIVIVIIGVLSTIGLVVFRGLSAGAKDAKIRADIDAISKVMESRYNAAAGTYLAWDSIEGSAFTSGSKPRDPDGNDYADIRTGSDNKSFIACAVLSDNSRYCRSSVFGRNLSDPGVEPSCSTVPALESGISGCRLLYASSNVIDDTIYTDCPAASENAVIITLTNCSGDIVYAFQTPSIHKAYTTRLGNDQINAVIGGTTKSYNVVFTKNGIPPGETKHPVTVRQHLP